MTVLSADNICFSIGMRDILKNISFSVENNDKVGLIGVNGAGKSTLLRLISGEYTPDSGSIRLSNGAVVGFMEQDMELSVISPEFAGSPVNTTVLGQMYAAFPELIRMERDMELLEEAAKKGDADAGLRLARVSERFSEDGGLTYRARCKSFLVRLGFDESYHGMDVRDLSGGQRTRLTLARLLASEPDVLMLDEPTNHLDADTLEWLEGHLAVYRKALIVVSHDRFFLDRVTNKTIEIEYGECRTFKGGYTEFAAKKKALREAEEKKYMLQQREIARLEAFIENQRKWNRERNIIAAESRQKAIDRMEKIEKPKDAPKSIRFNFTQSSESGNDVLAVRGLSMGFGERSLFENISFEVKKGERVFILGPNGCGKSTLIKLLMDKLTPRDGHIDYGYNVDIGYYDQENQNLTPENTVLYELWDAYPAVTQTELRGVLAAFMFRGDDIEKTVSVLSGGERARLTLAKLILSQMNLLILDEPTNHLDIPSREALEDALNSFEGTVISVSHDRYFISKLATRIIAFDGRGGIVDYRGTYQDYVEHLRAPEEVKVTETKESAGRDAYLERKREAADKRRQEKHVRDVYAEIEKLEHRLIEVTDALADSGSDYMAAAELEDERITIEDRLMQLYEEEETFEEQGL